MPRARRAGGRPVDHDGRGAGGAGRHAVAAAGRVPRLRRGAVRRLHAGDAHGRGRPARPHARADARRGPRRAGRRALPVHGLLEDRRGGRGGGPRDRRRAGRRGRAARRPDRRSAPGSRGSTASRRSPARSGSRDDAFDAGALTLRVVRSPHARATFELGDLDAVRRARTRASSGSSPPPTCPAPTVYGIYETGKDQPVLAEGVVRYAGEAVARARRRRGRRRPDPGRRAADQRGPRCRPCSGSRPALDPAAPRLHDDRPGNVLVRGRLARGDVDAALAGAAVTATGTFETTFVEHAYIEPEAGTARVVDGRVEVWATTQTPYMDRDELALILGLPKDARPGHPERLRRRLRRQAGPVDPAAPRDRRDGHRPPGPRRVLAAGVDARRRRSATRRGSRRRSAPTPTGGSPASASTATSTPAPTPRGAPRSPTACPSTRWARTPSVPSRPRTTAVHTNGPPAGAFRGFGVPQAAIAHEALLDDLAAQLGLDELEIRRRNALRAGSTTGSGQVLARERRAPGVPRRARAALGRAARRGRGVQRAGRRAGDAASGSASASGPCGTASATRRCPTRRPSTSGSRATGRVVLFSGATDIGQGSATVVAQIAADALGVPVAALALTAPRHRPDPRRRQDLGLAPDVRVRERGPDRRRGAPPPDPRARRGVGDGRHRGRGARRRRWAAAGPRRRGRLDPRAPRAAGRRARLRAPGVRLVRPEDDGPRRGRPGHPVRDLRRSARSSPLVEVDIELGTVRVRRMVAAHDVGRAINPTLVEGQVQGGIAQGIGMALMEAYEPGRTDNLHDYLIPTVGDAPEIEVPAHRGPRAVRPVRREGRRRACARPDGPGDPRRHPPRDGGPGPLRARDAGARPRGDPGGGAGGLGRYPRPAGSAARSARRSRR